MIYYKLFDIDNQLRLVTPSIHSVQDYILKETDVRLHLSDIKEQKVLVRLFYITKTNL